MTPQCRDAVNKAAGRTLSSAEIKNIDDRLSDAMRQQARRRGQEWAGLTREQRVLEGAKQAMADMKAAAERKAQNAFRQVEKTAELEDALDSIVRQAGVQKKGKLIPRSRALVRHMEQTDAYIKGIKDDYLRRLMDLVEATADTKDASLGRRMMMFLFDADNPAMSRDLVTEIIDNASGKTGNELARRGARAWLDTIETMRTRFNDAGGDVGKLRYGYVPQPHDMGRIQAAGAVEWTNKVIPLLDRTRYVREDGAIMSDAELREAIGPVWATLSTDGLNELMPGEFRGPGVLANAGSAHRTLHFRDADAYMSYMAEFGNGSVYDAIVQHVSGLARHIGLVERYGPSPELQMRTQFDVAAKEDGFARHVVPGVTGPQNLPTTFANSPQAYWNVLAGYAGVQARPNLAQIAQDIRNIQTAGKLAGAVISSITDLGTYFVTTGYNKLPYWEAIRNIGRQFDKETRDFLDMHGAIAESMASDLNRWAGDHIRNNLTGRLANSTMKLSLMNAWTDGLRRAFQMTMMGGLARLSKTKWGDLTEWDRSHLQRKGLTEADWEVVTRAQLTRFRDSDFLTPDAIYATGDAAAPQVVAKVLGLIRDESEYAVMNPDLATRVVQTWGGTQRGTGKGELARSVMQFKSFPIAMISRHWRRMMEGNRDLDGAPAISNRLAYGMALGVSLTALGAIAFQTKQVLQGKDPADMTSPRFWMRALAQGGGLGIVGDLFLVDPTESFGDSAANAIKNIGGPTVGSAADLVIKLGIENAWQGAAGKDTHAAAEGLQIARSHLPYINLWYARAAIDRMGMHALQENLSPGYLSRMKQRARRDWGQGFWWAPGDPLPERAPDLSTAGGQ